MIESSGNPVDKSYGMCNKSPMQQHSDTHSEDRGSKAKVKASVNNKEGKRKRGQRRQLRLSVRVCLALFACLSSAQLSSPGIVGHASQFLLLLRLIQLKKDQTCS
jgi:hypothetical protein